MQSRVLVGPWWSHFPSSLLGAGLGEGLEPVCVTLCVGEFGSVSPFHLTQAVPHSAPTRLSQLGPFILQKERPH